MDSGIKSKLDYSDYLAAPEDGKSYEILRGDLYVSPPPSPFHQRASRQLQRQLEDYFGTRGIGEVFDAPVALILTNRDIVEPDLIVVGDAGQITRRGIEGVPLLIVEVLSPSTGGRDRGVKANRYAELGVEHYWIVDPDAKTLECFVRDSGTYRCVANASGDETLRAPGREGLVIDLAHLWRGLPG